MELERFFAASWPQEQSKIKAVLGDAVSFEQVQKRIKNSKRRAPKPENGEKSIFADLLYCADCHSKLWYHVNTINKNLHFFSCSNYAKDYRGSCPTRHYMSPHEKGAGQAPTPYIKRKIECSQRSNPL